MPGMLGGAGRRGRAGARHHRDVHHHRVRGAAVAAGAAGRRPAAVCGWGEEPEWQPGTVVSTTPEAEGLRGLLVEVGEALSQEYDKPGQFVQLKVGDSKPAFIAIACPPAEAQAGQLELLIKDGDGTAGLLCGLEAGAAMDVSPVMGKGFPLDKADGSIENVLFFATGSGISPIRSLIESGAVDLAGVNAALYLGVKNEDYLPWEPKMTSWESPDVVLCFSAPKEGSGVAAEKGYVQDVFAATKENALKGDPAKTLAFVIGQKEMSQGVTAVLTAAGVPEENILNNF